MKRQMPRTGDIWRDGRGPFLVLDEHKLAPWDKSVGYVCSLSVLDMTDGVITHNWCVSNLMLDELVFVA